MESFNKVELAGKVVEIVSRTGLTKKNVPYVSGTIKIETGPDNFVPVDFFAQEINSKGTKSPLYTSLMTVKDEYKSIASHGRENADTIKLDMGKLTENLYSPDGVRINRGFKVNSNFFNRDANAMPANKFIVEGEVVAISEEIKSDVPTGVMLLDLLLLDFNKNAHIIQFSSVEPKASAYIKSTLSIGEKIKISGSVEVMEEDIVTKTQAVVGDDIEEHKTKTTRRLVLNSLSAPVPSDIPTEMKETALAVRESEIAKKKQEALNKGTAKSSTSAPGAGKFSL